MGEETDQTVAARWARSMYAAVHMEGHAIEDGALTETGLSRLRETMDGAIHLGILHSATEHAQTLLGSAYAMCLAIAKRHPQGAVMLDGALGQTLRATWGFTTEAQRERVAELRAAAAGTMEAGPCKHNGP
jgi:hypothetical protein